MTKIPPDDILEGLYKLRYESLTKSTPHWNHTTWKLIRKKMELDCHRLKTMVKRSVVQEIRNKNFGARNGNFEKNVLVKIREQNSVYKEFLETVGNGKPTGSV